MLFRGKRNEPLALVVLLSATLAVRPLHAEWPSGAPGSPVLLRAVIKLVIPALARGWSGLSGNPFSPRADGGGGGGGGGGDGGGSDGGSSDGGGDGSGDGSADGTGDGTDGADNGTAVDAPDTNSVDAPSENSNENTVDAPASVDPYGVNNSSNFFVENPFAGSVRSTGTNNIQPTGPGRSGGRTLINAVIITGLSNPALAISSENVLLTGGIVALGTAATDTVSPTWKRNVIVLPDPALLNGSKIPPITPNVIDVRIMRTQFGASIGP